MYCVLMNYYDMAYHNLYVFYGPGLLISIAPIVIFFSLNFIAP